MHQAKVEPFPICGGKLHKSPALPATTRLLVQYYQQRMVRPAAISAGSVASAWTLCSIDKFAIVDLRRPIIRRIPYYYPVLSEFKTIVVIFQLVWFGGFTTSTNTLILSLTTFYTT